MKPKEAIELAKRAIRAEAQKIAIDANLHDCGIVTYNTILAHNHYTELTEAARMLDELAEKAAKALDFQAEMVHLAVENTNLKRDLELAKEHARQDAELIATLAAREAKGQETE